MFVSAPVFLILLLPLFVHGGPGADNPPHDPKHKHLDADNQIRYDWLRPQPPDNNLPPDPSQNVGLASGGLPAHAEDAPGRDENHAAENHASQAENHQAENHASPKAENHASPKAENHTPEKDAPQIENHTPEKDAPDPNRRPPSSRQTFDAVTLKPVSESLLEIDPGQACVVPYGSRWYVLGQRGSALLGRYGHKTTTSTIIVTPSNPATQRGRRRGSHLVLLHDAGIEMQPSLASSVISFPVGMAKIVTKEQVVAIENHCEALDEKMSREGHIFPSNFDTQCYWVNVWSVGEGNGLVDVSPADAHRRRALSRRKRATRRALGAE